MMTDMEEAEAKILQSQIEIRNDEECEIDFKEATKKLAEGLLNQYQAQSEQVKKKLDEVRNKQETLLDQMQIENIKLQDTFDDVKLDEMVQTIKVSQGKLILMKKKMASIRELTFKLKKRALRLQQIKQKEALNREQQREQEIRREQELIGKPVMS
ncbi:unnamed protein product [Xylocopa violacea]|uniref:Biogenesis of lysosome-related organelles complex 1 subunit 6 n=1 Tax=Xylocopa violacea TaxID=135666 RepID=A0ABP1NX26_XYLVO